jgi:siroheme synthase-like protein
MIGAKDEPKAIDEEETRNWQHIQDRGRRKVNFRYPIFLDVSGKKCLVTGEGYEVAGKVQALVEAAAMVSYVNPRAERQIEAMAAAGLIRWVARAFEPADLEGCFLVISDCEDNSQVFKLAEEERVLCNAVDDPEHCRFSFGSVHRQGDLTIAISTNGWAPAVAVRLKERMQREIGAEYGELLGMLKEVRPQITSRIVDFGARRELWYRIVDSEILAMLRAGRREEADRALSQMIEEAYRRNQ